MKKLGTPSGAGPGSAKEKLGLAGVGTPGPVGPLVAGLTAFGLACFDFFWLAGFVPVVVEPEWLVRTWVFEWELPVWRGADEPPVCWAAGLCGAGDDGPPVVVDVVGVVEGLGVVEVDVVTVVVGVVLADGWQLAVTLLTGGVPGGSICAGGVPGAAFTVKVTVWPLSSVAATVH